MRRFAFRLENVLRLRGQMEEQARVELAQAMAERRRREQSVLEVYAALETQIRNLRDHQRPGREIDMDYVLAERRHLYYLRREIARRLQAFKEAEAETTKTRETLVEARRSRRSLELLRERHHAQWLAEGDREERMEFDEMATIAFMRARNEERSRA